MKNVIILFLLLVTLFSLPHSLMANGARFVYGIYGSEIIADNPPPNNFIVDEKVVIDIQSRIVTVQYDIINQSSDSSKLNILFPIQSYRDCNEKRINEFEFTVKLNGSPLSYRQIPKNSLQILGAEYVKLISITCGFFAFDADIVNGDNSIFIKYKLLESGGQSFSGNPTWDYRYDIWPAKNWVNKFRSAQWSVILPETIFGMEKIDGNLYANNPHSYGNGYISWDSLYTGDVSVFAPGIRKESKNQIDFNATDFVPADKIHIEMTIYPAINSLHSCSEDSPDYCRDFAIHSTLSIRPYTGNKRCYTYSDLKVVFFNSESFIFDPQALPILRNEIYARNGYKFKTAKMIEFFRQMPWYKLEF